MTEPGAAPLAGFEAPTITPHARRVARGLVLAAAVLWSGGGAGVKLLGGCEARTIAGYRAVFAALVMGAALLRTRRPAEVLGALRRPRIWGAAASYALMVVCFVIAAKLTTAANAILLQYTAPIYVALVSPALLGERVGPRDLLAVAATVTGMVLFFLGDLSLDGRVGNLVAILSSFGFAGLPVWLRLEDRARRREGLPEDASAPLVAMTLGNLLAALVCAPRMLAAPPTTASAWEVLALLGTLQIAVPYLLYARAVRALPALESSLLASVEPILSPLWVLLATGERPGSSALAGGALIVCAVTFQATAKRAPARADAARDAVTDPERNVAGLKGPP